MGRGVPAPGSPPATPEISTRAVLGLVVVIAVMDVVTNAVLTDGVQLAVKLTTVVALLLWARRWVGCTWDELGLGRERLGAGARLGGLAVLVVAVVIAVAAALPATRSFFEGTSADSDSTARHVLMPLLVIPLGTVVFEEVIFRGVLLAVLLRRCTRRWAVAWSSVLFGLWHVVPATSDARGKAAAAAVGVVVGTIAVTTGAGVVFTWLRLRSGSLLAPVLAHVATNSLPYIAAVITSGS